MYIVSSDPSQQPVTEALFSLFSQGKLGPHC